MKYDKKDKAKIAGLAAILIVLWVFIGIRFALVSRASKAQEHARQQSAAAEKPQSTGTPSAAGSKAVSPALRLAALVAPVPPPKSDPFHPIISPRVTGGTTPAPSTGKRSRESGQAPPVLPPMPGSESTPGRGGGDLQLTGIIAGTPSTAVLRLGEDHFVVREGDILDSTLRVMKITKTTVTLRDGRTAYTLRLGS